MNFRTIVGVGLIFIGLGFLIDFPSFNIFMALLLIYLGFRFISGKGPGLNFASSSTVHSESDSFSRVMVFTSTRVESKSKNFSGGEFVSVFAEGEVDLRGAETQRAVNDLELVSVFGSLKVRVPSDWEVNTQDVGFMGSVNNSTVRPENPKSKLHLEGAAVFGSIEITN